MNTTATAFIRRARRVFVPAAVVAAAVSLGLLLWSPAPSGTLAGTVLTAATSGTSGASGASATSGSSGASGASGTSGASGASGASGTSGATTTTQGKPGSSTGQGSQSGNTNSGGAGSAPVKSSSAGAQAGNSSNASGGAAGSGTALSGLPANRVSLAIGKTLFDESCASCHGTDAQGSALAPSLHGLGAGTVDLWVSSGWMPLAVPTAQPLRKPNRFSRAQTISIAKYVSSLSNNQGYPIPSVNLAGTSRAKGLSIYAEICAACHTITGAGDQLSAGIEAPSLHDVTKAQIMEAVRTGPGNMPRFGPGILTDQQVKNVIAYVVKDIQHPTSPGGVSLGGVGPVAEGFVGLFIGVGACVLVAYWIGDRTPRGPEGIEQHGDGHGGDGGDGDGPGTPGGGDGREREVEHA